MKAIVERRGAHLVGVTEQDQANFTRLRSAMKQLPDGQSMRLEWARPRNGAHHRKAFALLQLIADHHEVYDTPERALVAVKILTGHVDVEQHPIDGTPVLVPRSIAYESMDQDTFAQWYEQAIDAICQHLLPQLDRATAERLAAQISQGW